MKKIALIGNPNCGKTTIFNLLTGLKQKVGNWSGVTVSKKTGNYSYNKNKYQIIDLPGIYSLEASQNNNSYDEEVSQNFLSSDDCDLIIHIIDASNLEKSLFLTSSLLKLNKKMIIIFNMMDIVKKRNIFIDIKKLANNLQTKIIVLPEKEKKQYLREEINKEIFFSKTKEKLKISGDYNQFLKEFASNIINRYNEKKSFSDKADKILLNKYLGIPIFFFVMYLMFVFSINIGGAFVDFFDILSGSIFVDGSRFILTKLHIPEFLQIIIADGIGAGIQIVTTFIPIIAFLYIFLSFLEDSGYMARVAFIMNKAMNKIGLSGKAFVPLIIGFGCSVPAIMSSRILDSNKDRMTVIMMSPFFSCGAKLPVYILFTTAFFPHSGQNIVFLLYLIGIAIAIFTGLIINKLFNNKQKKQSFLIELPSYHLPSTKNILINSWQKVKIFMFGAGKLIIIIVTFLTILNSISFNGDFKKNNYKNSVLSDIGKGVTYIFQPIGVTKENWPAGVGIFTGIFAKEVIVGTLNNLYSSFDEEKKKKDSFLKKVKLAFLSIKDNFKKSFKLSDPIGINIGDVSKTDKILLEQGVHKESLTIIQKLFNGKIAAFAYLLFILLYTPCSSAIGAVYKEINLRWAIIVSGYSTIFAYFTALIFYQTATFFIHPLTSSIWLISIIFISVSSYYYIKNWYSKKPEEIDFDIKLYLTCGSCPKKSKNNNNYCSSC